MLKEKYDFMCEEHGVLQSAESERAKRQDSARSNISKNNTTLRKLQIELKSRKFN